MSACTRRLLESAPSPRRSTPPTTNVLVAQAAHALAGGETVPATGPSFRDATRVAGASATIWPDIYLSNREMLVTLIDEVQERLGDVRAALAAADRAAIERWNDAARIDRDALLGAGLVGGAVFELRAAVTDRPGIVAEIALALGRAGINIVDMALSPARDGRKPSNANRSVASPAMLSAAVIAEAPGTARTSMPAAAAARTRPKPGSDSSGVPASLTSAMTLPASSCCSSGSSRASSL